MNMKKTKSIKRTLLFGMIGLSVSISILLGAASCIALYKTSYDSMDSEVMHVSQAYGEAVQNKIAQYKTAIEAIGRNESITKNGATAEELKAAKEKLAKQYGFMDVHTADAAGKNDLGTSCADREYFKQAMNGVTYISSPLTRKSDGSTVVYIAAKIDNASGYSGIVFAALSSDTFSSMVDNAVIGDSGYTFVLDNTGTVVANKDKTVVNKFVNYLDQAKKSGNTQQASVTQNMIAGKTGSQSYTVDGVNHYIAYRPISGAEKWSIGATATVSDMMGNFYSTIYLLIGLAIFFILIAGLIAFRIAKPIAKPIISMVQRFEKLAQGDLHTEVPVIASEDEIGVLSNTFASTVTTLNNYVGEISSVLTSLSKGDCTVEAHQEYLGDFVSIKTALNVIISNLNSMFTNINQSADQVSSGSDQVASASQALAQGATQQASSIEELSASVTEIANEVNKNATNANNANQISLQASSEVQRGNEHMQQMSAAMQDISEKSNEIGKIIKTIEDIAFQTNILALNAAVEAARAGEAGKGFSVVADEVRNLASKSAEAAKNTTTLIESTIQAVDNGTKIAEETAASLNAIIDGAKKTTDLISEISKASNEQANSINQIMIGVDQISAVVQTNSATSEESAATSEELSGQAKTLKETLAFLKLKDQTASPNQTKQIQHAPAPKSEPLVGDKY